MLELSGETQSMKNVSETHEHLSTNELLALYVSGAMDQDRSRLFEHLLARDPDLRRQFELLRNMPDLKDVPKVEVPDKLLLIPISSVAAPPQPAFWEGFTDRLRQISQRLPHVKSNAASFMIGSLATAAVLLLILGPSLSPTDSGTRGSRTNGVMMGREGAWAVLSSLLGGSPGDERSEWTGRNPETTRVLILFSTMPARAFTYRVNNSPDAIQSVGTPTNWRSVDGMSDLQIPLDRPPPEADAEWFVTVFVLNPPAGLNNAPSEAQLNSVSASLQRLLREQLPIVRRTTTREKQDRLEKDLAKAVSRATNMDDVRISIRHWKVRKE